MDVIYLALIAVFFVLTAAFVFGCARLGGAK